jgi:hypothetical protein
LRRLKLGLICVAATATIGYGAYLAYLVRSTYTGYCHAAEKYLTDDEKIRVAIADVMKQYPPSVILRKHDADAAVEGYLPPENPIYYRDVDEFLAINRNCCSISILYKGPESFSAGFKEKVTGTMSGVLSVRYLVRYLTPIGTVQNILIVDQLPMSNCGKPVRWLNPLHSNLFFFIQFFKSKETL